MLLAKNRRKIGHYSYFYCTYLYKIMNIFHRNHLLESLGRLFKRIKYMNSDRGLGLNLFTSKPLS